MTWTTIIAIASGLGTLTTGIIAGLLFRAMRSLPRARVTRLEVTNSRMTTLSLALVSAHEFVIFTLSILSLYHRIFPGEISMLRTLVIGTSFVSIVPILILHIHGKHSLEERITATDQVIQVPDQGRQ